MKKHLSLSICASEGLGLLWKETQFLQGLTTSGDELNPSREARWHCITAQGIFDLKFGGFKPPSEAVS